MKLVSVNRAHKQKIEFDHKLVDTGLFMNPVYLSGAGIERDTIADLSMHGGADRTIPSQCY
jgi:MOSC domain-containing protein YiiM